MLGYLRAIRRALSVTSSFRAEFRAFPLSRHVRARETQRGISLRCKARRPAHLRDAVVRARFSCGSGHPAGRFLPLLGTPISRSVPLIFDVAHPAFRRVYARFCLQAVAISPIGQIAIAERCSGKQETDHSEEIPVRAEALATASSVGRGARRMVSMKIRTRVGSNWFAAQRSSSANASSAVRAFL